MTDRIEVDLHGVAGAAATCRSTGTTALTNLTALLRDLTKSAIEAAAGHDDYGKQITDGWTNSHADQFPEFAKAIQLQLIGRADQMSACAANAEATDESAARQVHATDLGLIRLPEGWATTPSTGDED